MECQALRITLFPFLLLVASCASSDPWYREGITAATFERDKQDCIGQASSQDYGKPADTMRSSTAQNLTNAIFMGSNISSCLEKKGYKQVKPGQRAASSPL